MQKIKNTQTDIFLSRYPSIDLHGYDRDSARVMTNDFIRDNLTLGNDTVVIIHGKGTGTLKKEVHEALRINKHVMQFKVDNFNSGCTIIKIGN